MKDTNSKKRLNEIVASSIDAHNSLMPLQRIRKALRMAEGMVRDGSFKDMFKGNKLFPNDSDYAIFNTELGKYAYGKACLYATFGESYHLHLGLSVFEKAGILEDSRVVREIELFASQGPKESAMIGEYFQKKN